MMNELLIGIAIGSVVGVGVLMFLIKIVKKGKFITMERLNYYKKMNGEDDE